MLKVFKAVEHRIEYVTEKRGVRFYNDSKGTNPDAAIQGIRAMNRPTLLIGGGYDKQSEYDEWIEAFDGKVKELVLIGQTADKIEECAHRHGFMNTVKKDTFEDAVNHLRCDYRIYLWLHRCGRRYDDAPHPHISAWL